MAEPFIGEIKMFAGAFAPRNYAFCNGTLLAVAGNEALFSLISNSYGGDGRSDFALPDMRGRIPVHQGQGPGLTNRILGQSFGVETVGLTIDQIPNHNHAMQASQTVASFPDPVGRVFATTTVNAYDNSPENPTDIAPESIAVVGSNIAHDNMMPFLGINFIIALKGNYPSRN